MPSRMTGRLKNRARRSLALCMAGGLALGLAAASCTADAATARASANATVMAIVPVNTFFLGTPVTVRDLLAAWHGPAGPQTGAYPIRLPDVAPPDEPLSAEQRLAARLSPEESLVWSEARTMQIDAGLLQAGLVAAVSAVSNPEDDDHGTLLFVTIAFN